MHQGIRSLLTAAAGAALTAFVSTMVAPVSGQQAPAYRAPRGADGHPDLNGIWQALNEANYDVEMHMARPALQTRPGPYGPVPAPPVLAMGAVGIGSARHGRRRGREIPYKPEALAQRRRTRRTGRRSIPEVKCYLPGVPRANYMPQPFQIFQSNKAIFFAYQYAGAVRNIYLKDPGPAPVDSWMGQSVGKWEGDTLVDRRDRLQRSDLVRSRRQLPQRASCTSSSATRARLRTCITYEATIEDPERLHPAVEDDHAALSPRSRRASS